MQALVVRLGGGEKLGVVEESPSWWSQKLTVKDSGGELLYDITGPCWTCSCGGDLTFDVGSRFSSPPPT